MTSHPLKIDSPFGSEEIPEVLLERDALDLVVAQIRFPAVMSISDDREIARFQELIRDEYPILREDRNTGVMVSPEGFTLQPQDPQVWRFHSIDEIWQISVAPNFIALMTTDYSNRKEFFDRLNKAVSALASIFRPVIYERLGVRYVNRWTGDDLGKIPTYINAEMLGSYSSINGSDVTIQQMISSAFYALADGQLRVNSGLMPANATVDPGVPPINQPGWLLDLDRFVEGARSFESDAIVADAIRFAKDNYRFFRWAVTPQFLIDRGAEL